MGKTFIEKDTCTPMFIAALFTIAKTWKQSKCPSKDEWIKKMWNTTKTKKEQNNAICSNMDGTIDTLSEVSQKDKDKYHMISHISGI